MADDKTTKTKDTSKQLGPVAELSVPKIIAALHQSAVEHCRGDLGDKYRIVNSAVDDTGEQPVLVSSGKQFVCVIPAKAEKLSDIAKDENSAVPKANAVKILQTYMQWFVGPDKAKFVSNKTVMPLDDQESSIENTKEPNDIYQKTAADKEAVAAAKHDLTDNESITPFMTFSQFLHEAEDSESSSADAKPDPAKTETDPAESKPENTEKTEKADADKKDGNGEYAVGYAVEYELEVEGIKQDTKAGSWFSSFPVLRAAKNFILNFFDDVTFKASGLFGGSDSFSIKDVKDSMRKTFGPIDPDQLARNVEDRIDKKFKGSSPHADVKVRDKKTLIADLGSYIDGKQKKLIDSADYSLWIKIDQDDPKKNLFNRQVIADIVVASISGMWKKVWNKFGFRKGHKINRDSVIYIPDFKNIHGNTEKIRALYQMVPSPNAVRDKIQSASNANKAIAAVDKLLQRIGKDKDKDDCDRANRCYKAWMKFKANNDVDHKIDELTDTHRGTEAFDKFFKAFIDLYVKEYNRTEDKSLNESLDEFYFVVSDEQLSKLVLESMFSSQVQSVEEADEAAADEDEDDDDTFSFEDLKSWLLQTFKQQLSERYNDPAIVCGTRREVRKQLRLFQDPDKKLKNDKYAYAAAIFAQNMSLMKESNVGDEIFSILFENGETSQADSSSNVVTAQPYSKEEFNHKLMRVFNQSFTASNAKPFSDELIVLKPKEFKEKLKAPEEKPKEVEEKPKEPETLTEKRNKSKNKGNDESSQKEKKPEVKKLDLENAYVMLFGDEKLVPVDTPDTSLDSLDTDKGQLSHDLYIVPIAKMHYEDPEFANKNL